MSSRNRAWEFALSKGTPSNEDIEGELIDVVIDPDHPETINSLSLREYIELKKFNAQQVPFAEGEQVSTESFGEHWQNFKNRFEGEMANEDAYIDHLLERFKKLREMAQAAKDVAPSNVPVNLFANARWFQLKIGRGVTNKGTLQTELERLLDVNERTSKQYLASFAEEIKYAHAFLAQGASDLKGAFEKAYVTHKAVPAKGFEDLVKHSVMIPGGHGKSFPGKESDPYLGGWKLRAWQLTDFLKKGVDRGIEYFTGAEEGKDISKIQLPALSRTEAIKMIDTSIKMLECVNAWIDNALRAERSMLADKLDRFEDQNARWRQYPQEEKEMILHIFGACEATLDRGVVLLYILNGTRKTMRAFERYIELSLQRLK